MEDHVWRVEVVEWPRFGGITGLPFWAIYHVIAPNVTKAIAKVDSILDKEGKLSLQIRSVVAECVITKPD